MRRETKLALRALDREMGPRLCAARIALSEARRNLYVAARNFVGSRTRCRHPERTARWVPRPADDPHRAPYEAARYTEQLARFVRFEAEAEFWRRRADILLLDVTANTHWHYAFARSEIAAGHASLVTCEIRTVAERRRP